MKYTVEDIKALIEVEKKTIEKNEEKKHSAYDIALENAKTVDFRDLIDTMMAFGHCIEFNFPQNQWYPHRFDFTDKKDSQLHYYIYHSCDGKSFSVYFCTRYGMHINDDGLFKFTRFADGTEKITKDRTQNGKYYQESLISIFNWIYENQDFIRNEYEKTIEREYEKKMQKVVDLANKEF